MIRPRDASKGQGTGDHCLRESLNISLSLLHFFALLKNWASKRTALNECIDNEALVSLSVRFGHSTCRCCRIINRNGNSGFASNAIMVYKDTQRIINAEHATHETHGNATTAGKLPRRVGEAH